MERLTNTFLTLFNESPRRFVMSLDNFEDIYASADDSVNVQQESEEKVKRAIASIPLPKTIVPEHDTSISQPLPDYMLRKQHSQLLELLDHERALIKECEDTIASVNACIKQMEGVVCKQVSGIQRAKNVGNDFKMHRTRFRSMIERLFPRTNKEMMIILSDLVDCNYDNKYVRIPANTTPAILATLHKADLIEIHPERDSQIKLKKIL